ncbi:TonB-dependent receptor domain-containing protein [Pseudoalteromonas sp. T1lg65]|uniref:TonB-dependent receptor domain-containing protein n=1 Tax=Pseudoalteromonas sp. T1lg65 TaxID=2077101 RepID=UPI003F7A12ED
MLNNKVSKAVRLAIAFGAASTAFASMSVAAEEQEKEEVERIQVTGSKIKRIGELSPTPVTVITGDTLTDAGITNVANLLEELPSATVGLSPETTNNSVFANGLSNTNLRGMGINRTLVLVNGRRFVAGSPTSSAVDLNNIPTAMIERIEVSTGGASAVYGSDAIAGVVNIITKKSIDGFEVDASTRDPEQSGGESSYASFTFGKEADTFSFIGNVSYTKDKQLRGDQRDFIRDAVLSIDHPNNVNSTDGIPGRIILNGREEGGSTLAVYNKTGDFFTADGHWTFADDGSIRPFETGEFFPESTTPGSRNLSYYTGKGDGYNFLEHSYVRTPLERINVATNFNADINDAHRMAFEFMYSNTSAYGESSPAFFGLRGMRADNAFFSDETRQFFADRDMSTYNAYYLAADLGNRVYDQKRENIRAALSFEGELTDTWSYDAYVQIGQTKQRTTWKGELITERFYDSLDAVMLNGEIVCADRDQSGEVIGALSGCSPLNIWGRGLASEEALDYVTTDATREARVKQSVAGLTVAGDLFELPAGPVASAFSFEYREEISDTAPDALMRKGLIFNNQTEALTGKFDVTEYSAEVSVPIIADIEFVQDFYVELAYRYMDYSTTGTDNAWKVGLNYAMNDDFRVRLNRSRSVRAPNIDELFSAKAETFRSFSDPCEQGRIDNATEYKDNIERNCRAAGIPVGWAPTDDWKKTNHSGFGVGNPDLDNEVADDITIGFIYTPNFIEDLSITVDYWKFELEQQITSPTGSTIVSSCYELDSLDNEYCKLIERDPTTLEITAFYEKPINAANSTVEGTDVEVNYGLESEYGKFDFRLVATYTAERMLNTTGKAEDERYYQGEVHRPRWKGRFTVNYSYEDFAAALTTNYRHATVNDREWTPEDNNYNDIESYVKVDLTARYNINDDLQVRGGLLNVFDVEPPRHPTYYDDGEFFDLDGRTLTLGVNYKF